MSAPAVFLDRDGTLMEDTGYVRSPADVRLYPGTRESLQRLKAAGFRLVIITNQSGIGRGIFTTADYEAVHARLMEELGAGLIDAAYMCPDDPNQGSVRRKPSPAMILDAARDWGLDLTRSWMIGDKDIDVQCGLRAGVRSVLVLSGQGRREHAAGASFVAADLPAATELILSYGEKAAPPPISPIG